jgi:hypothetical protein
MALSLHSGTEKENRLGYIEFEVIAAVDAEGNIFRNVTLCRPRN